jgi:hypothetical protein
MCITWAAIAGTTTAIPYFYPLFFLTVLVHRVGRDFERYAIRISVYAVSRSRLTLTGELQMLDQVRKRLGALLLHCQIQIYSWCLLGSKGKHVSFYLSHYVGPSITIKIPIVT